jgi:ankyrin repeat protein
MGSEADRCRHYERHRVAHEAFEQGDLEALRAALDDPPDFPNSLMPCALAVGDHCLEYAIYWSPLPFIRSLLMIGANPNYDDRAGFPSLIAALDRRRSDKHDVLALLLSFGADTQQRGINDWTPLHCAVGKRDLPAVELLLAHGADPLARTRIDDCTTPLEDAERIGFSEAVLLLTRRARKDHDHEQ